MRSSVSRTKKSSKDLDINPTIILVLVLTLSLSFVATPFLVENRNSFEKDDLVESNIIIGNIYIDKVDETRYNSNNDLVLPFVFKNLFFTYFICDTLQDSTNLVACNL